MHLKISSAKLSANNCLILLTNLSIEANSLDLDHVCHRFLKHLTDDKCRLLLLWFALQGLTNLCSTDPYIFINLSYFSGIFFI